MSFENESLVEEQLWVMLNVRKYRGESEGDGDLSLREEEAWADLAFLLRRLKVYLVQAMNEYETDNACSRLTYKCWTDLTEEGDHCEHISNGKERQHTLIHFNYQ